MRVPGLDVQETICCKCSSVGVVCRDCIGWSYMLPVTVLQEYKANSLLKNGKQFVLARALEDFRNNDCNLSTNRYGYPVKYMKSQKNRMKENLSIC